MPIITDRMTNSQILESSDDVLTLMQKQIKFLMKQGLQGKACPNCGELHNLTDPAGVEVDDFDFSNPGGNDHIGKCRKCYRTLIFTLALSGTWPWRLDPAEAAIA